MIVFLLQVSVHRKKLIYTVCHLLLTLIVTYDKHHVSNCLHKRIIKLLHTSTYINNTSSKSTVVYDK